MFILWWIIVGLIAVWITVRPEWSRTIISEFDHRSIYNT